VVAEASSGQVCPASAGRGGFCGRNPDVRLKPDIAALR
jgi:hypothetical protein